jgi:hypothetical protein
MHSKRFVSALRRVTVRMTADATAGPLPGHLYTLLGWRLTALGLNPKDIERHSPHLLVQLKGRCALCADKRRCLEGMMDFRHPPGWEGYCPNAAAIRGLLTAPGARGAETATGGDP